MKTKMLWKTTWLKADMRMLQQLRILYTRHQDFKLAQQYKPGHPSGAELLLHNTLSPPRPQHHRNKRLPLAAAACRHPVPATPGQLWEKEELLIHRKSWQWIRKRLDSHRNYNLNRKFSCLAIHMAHCHSIQEVSQNLNTSPSWSAFPSSLKKVSQYHWPDWLLMHFELAPSSFSLKLHNWNDTVLEIF